MSASLFIFVTSERPDPYLNSIIHGLLNEGVKEVIFVHIKGLEDPSPIRNELEGRGISATVLRNVQILLDGLAAAGEYRYFSDDKSGKRVDLATKYTDERLQAIRDFYKQALDKDVTWLHHDIRYSDLRSCLKNHNGLSLRSIKRVIAK